MSEINKKYETYYVPESSYWPIIAAAALFTFLFGVAAWLQENPLGIKLFVVGLIMIVFMMAGWFRRVVLEGLQGLNSSQMDMSYRWGMSWFIFSEVLFFAAFFGALFYTRLIALPDLAGLGNHSSMMTNYLLWPNFQLEWPLFQTPDPTEFLGAKKTVSTWELPALNTLILLTSGGTITWAHWALKKNLRKQLVAGMLLTVLLGLIFLVCQSLEYHEAMHEYGLTLGAGIYGTVFFLLTGFHGMHVTIGTIMLIVITVRCLKGHFTKENHFAFEGVAWYWHFVDVVWLFLFVFVYWL